MKLSDLLPIAAEIDVLHPVTGTPVGAKLQVVGRDSAQFRKTRNEIFQRRSLRSSAITVEDIAAENDELIAACIVGWSPEEFFEGPWSPEAATAVIRNPGYSWLAQQIDAFSEKNANFFRPSDPTA